MTTVQDLINMYRKAQEYEYDSILIVKSNGQSERYSNVNNLQQESKDIITFTSTVDIRDICPESIPTVREIVVMGRIIESSKRIL